MAIFVVLLVLAFIIPDGYGLFAITSLGLLLIIRSMVIQAKSQRLRKVGSPMKFMWTVVGFFLLGGMLIFLFLFYSIVHDTDLETELGHKVMFTNIEYLARSITGAIDLFMLDVDTNILDRLDMSPGIKAMLSIWAILSFLCAVALIIGLVYTRVKAYYRITYLAKPTEEKDHIYIFFGDNEPSRLLIKDIVGNRKDPRAIPIIIEDTNENENSLDLREDALGMVSRKRHLFKTTQNLGAFAAISSQSLDKIDSEAAGHPDFDIFAHIGVPKIKKIIDALTALSTPDKTRKSQLHFFFMGEDEEQNIRSIIALAKDSTVRKIATNNNIEHRIYCHARFNGPNRVVEDIAKNEKLQVKIVDSSHLAVEHLKMEPEYHPIRVVDISPENPATVSSALSCLIVGFGEVGRDAFRFLYEFGSFVGDASTDSESVRSPFGCTIVDPNLNNIKGSLQSSMPAIFAGEQGARISFLSEDSNSSDFHMEVFNDEYLKSLNYVVISIGHNDEAIALGTRIFERVRQVRSDLSKLRIFVRCTDDSKVEFMQKIADHYNNGYGESRNNTPIIHIFGQPQKTYTYDLVVSDEIIELGKKFLDKYNEIKGGRELTWEERRTKLLKPYPPVLDNLRSLQRKESQDIANAMHIGTKLYILEKTLNGIEGFNWKDFYKAYFLPNGSPEVKGGYNKESGHVTEIVYPKLSHFENRIILRLAMLEHTRWNAAHELMGYRLCNETTGCNERTREHNCLCGWEMLDAKSQQTREQDEWQPDCDYKKYDFIVVDTTIALAKDYLVHKQKKINPK